MGGIMTLNVPCPTTTTSTTTAAPIFVDLYITCGDSTLTQFDFYYKINSGADTLFASSFNSTICVNQDTLQVSSGANVTIIAYISGGANVYINGSNGNGFCPSNSAVYCSYLVSNITSTTSIEATIYIDINGDPQICT